MDLQLILCQLLLATAAQTLTIDTQLGTSIEDCFERVSLGERLLPDATYRNISELSTRECEKICKQDKQCQSYDYGIGAKGNSTCNLSNLGENDIKSSSVIQRHLDYDIYVRRFQCEQSPPTPLKPIFDDQMSPNRPVIRPDHLEDPNNLPQRPHQDNRPHNIHKPLSDDLQRPIDDLKPYESNNRPERPFVNKTPYRKPIKDQYYDNYFDRPNPIGYDGNLDRPYKRPYRPEHNDVSKPSYNNILDYERPDDYGSLKPDYDGPIGYGVHRPQDTHYKPKPVYDKPTFTRPSQAGYNNTYRPMKPDPNDVLYFQNHYNFEYSRPIRPHYEPSAPRPDPYYPPRPEDDINDIYGPKPSRPHQQPRPDFHEYYKPLNDKPAYDIFIRPNKKPYLTQTQNPESSHDIAYDRPDPISSQKPVYDPPAYASQTDPIGPPINKPYQRPDYDRPIHSQQRPGYNRPTGSYDSSYRPSGYQKPDDFTYLEVPAHPQRPQRPTYVPSRPTYNDDSGSFGYGSQGQYGSQSNSQSYGYDIHSGSSHGNQNNGYGSQSSSIYNQVSSTGHGMSHSGYGTQTPNQYGGSSSSSGIYGSQGTHSGGHDNQHGQGGYGNQNNYGSQQAGPSYGIQANRPITTQKPSSPGSYGDRDRPSQTGSYGNNNPPSQTGYGDQKPGYGSQSKPDGHNHVKPTLKPDGVKPVYEYELDKPVGERPIYVQRPSGEVVSSKPVAVGGVQFDKPVYGGTGQDLSGK